MKTTRNRRNTCKRVLAMLTALTMSFSMLQSVAFASEGEDTTSSNPEITVIAVDGTSDETSGPDTTDTGDGTTEDGTTNEDGTAQVTPVDGESTEGTEDGTPADGENTEGTEDGTPADGENTENTENGIPADGENTEGTEDGTPAGGENTEDTEDGTPADGETSQEPVEEEVPDFPVNGTAEEQQAWYEKYTKRPEQSDEVGTTTGDPTDVPQKPAEGSDPTETPEEPTNWSVFWNPETNSYELTYEIDENAKDFEQTIDLTKALELLTQYAKEAEKPEEPVKPSNVSPEEMAAYEAEKAEFDDFYINEIIPFVIQANDDNYVKNHTMEEIVEEFNQWSWMHKVEVSIPVKPEATVDENSPEYQDYLKDLEAYNKALEDYQRQLNANVLQPGDIRKFEIFLTSKSGHTYKYKDGSFTLATPELGKTEGDIKGFDGQILPDGDNGYVGREQEYTVSGMMKPLRELLESANIPRGEMGFHKSLEDLLDSVGRNDRFGGESALQKVADALELTYTEDKYGYHFEGVATGVKKYLVEYYSKLDGVTYNNLDEVFVKSASARADVSATENVAQTTDKHKWTFGDEILTATYGPDFTFNNFYQNLLSFVYGDAANVEELLGGKDGINSSFHPQYDNKNWSSDRDGMGLDLEPIRK